MLTRYIGRCSCGSVLDRPFNDEEQPRITAWKTRHIQADGVRGAHLLTEDRTYETGGPDEGAA